MSNDTLKIIKKLWQSLVIYLSILRLGLSLFLLILKLRQNHIHLVFVKVPVLLFMICAETCTLQIIALCCKPHLELFEVDGLDSPSYDLIKLHSCRRIFDVSFTLTGDIVSIYQGGQAIVKFDRYGPEFSGAFVV